MIANAVREESALVVPVPEAEEVVRDWRLRHDPSAAAGVPAHITILYPFLPPREIDESALADLEGLFAASPAIRFALARVGRFAEVVYLAPEPAQPFSALIERVARRYPQCPPYGGALAVEEVVPHLTAAQTADRRVLDAAAEALAQHLPIAAHAREIWLLAKGADARWRTRHSFMLGGRSTTVAG